MASRKELYVNRSAYSWASKVEFVLDSNGGFKDLDVAIASFLWSPEYILTIEEKALHPLRKAGGASGYTLTIVATDTATSAELLGNRLAYSLLRVALEQNWGLALSWPDSPLPCRVIDRSASPGMLISGFMSTSNKIQADNFIASLEKGFSRFEVVPHRLLLSMELCAASRLESSVRSRLVMQTSAIEALAEQRDMTGQIGTLIQDLKKVVDGASLDDERLRASILGRIRELKRESARRAIVRTLQDAGISSEDQQFVDGAYEARSAIVHEGKRVPNLSQMVSQLDGILQRIYESQIPSSDR